MYYKNWIKNLKLELLILNRVYKLRFIKFLDENNCYLVYYKSKSMIWKYI